MKLVLFLGLMLFTLLGQTLMAEEITYTIEKEFGDIQIRNYRQNVVAEIAVSGSLRDAPNKAFMSLFSFIQGSNSEAQKIPMTAPVSQVSSLKLTTTARLAQEQSSQVDWIIAFYLPEDMNYKKIPIPKNDKISIREIPERRVAAIKFSGTMHNSNVNKYERELRTYLEDSNTAFEDGPMYAYYSSPFVPWFLRHNEIMFTLK